MYKVYNRVRRVEPSIADIMQPMYLPSTHSFDWHAADFESEHQTYLLLVYPDILHQLPAAAATAGLSPNVTSHKNPISFIFVTEAIRLLLVSSQFPIGSRQPSINLVRSSLFITDSALTFAVYELPEKH